MKNWRSRKMNSGQPNQAGTMSGRKVSVHLSMLKSTYCGMSVTMPGNIIVPSTSMNRTFLPRARSRAKP